jgi:hypothetical protein
VECLLLAQGLPEDQYPGAPINVNVNYYNFNFTGDPHCPYAGLNITWQPPTGGKLN